MKIYLFRIKKELFDALRDPITLTIDFLPPDCQQTRDGDTFFVYTSENLTIVGMYEKKSSMLQRKKPANLALKSCWEQLSFVKTVSETTSRLFKRKCRELTQEDYAVLQKVL